MNSRHRLSNEAPIREWHDPEKTSFTRSPSPRYLKPAAKRRLYTVLQVFVPLTGALVFFAWLNSPLRDTLIQLHYVKCSKSPWYTFDLMSPTPDTYSFEELSLPLPAIISTTKPTVGHLQICTHPRKHWALAMLLDNHRKYAENFGITYLVCGGGERGAGEKPVHIREFIEKELGKQPNERLDWIFYSDVDTLIVNPHIDIQTFLPPIEEGGKAFLIISRDWQELNAGTFFIKVDQRSVDVLRSVEQYLQRKNPIRGDQSALIVISEGMKLEQKGELVFMDQNLFNSYEGQRGFQEIDGIFQIHFPSLNLKRRDMMPLLEAIQKGDVRPEIRKYDIGRDRVKAELKDFWIRHIRLRQSSMH